MNKQIIGRNTYIDIMEYHQVPAKIDTGADSSAIWASDINMTKEGILEFKLFGPTSPFYDGQTFQRDKYSVVASRSSHGDEKIFYRVYIPIIIKGHKINVLFNLADRHNNHFPILIGRRTLAKRFIVDVGKSTVILPRFKKQSPYLNNKLQKNPYRFHQKYFKTEE